MQKINFQNLPNTTTPINATNLNQMQNNMENAFKNTYSTSQSDGYSADYVNEHYGWSEVTEGYTLLDNYIYYKKVGKMVTIFRPARTTSNSYIQNEIVVNEWNYTNLNASNKLLPEELRPNARIVFPVYVHSTDNQFITRSYIEVMENGNIAIYNWGAGYTANRICFCATYMVD